MLYSCANCFAMCGRKCESAPVVVVWIAVIGIMMRNTRHIYTVYTCIISKWNKKLKAKRARAHTYTHWLFGQHESQIMKKKQKTNSFEFREDTQDIENRFHMTHWRFLSVQFVRDSGLQAVQCVPLKTSSNLNWSRFYRPNENWSRRTIQPKRWAGIHRRCKQFGCDVSADGTVVTRKCIHDRNANSLHTKCVIVATSFMLRLYAKWEMSAQPSHLSAHHTGGQAGSRWMIIGTASLWCEHFNSLIDWLDRMFTTQFHHDESWHLSGSRNYISIRKGKCITCILANESSLSTATTAWKNTAHMHLNQMIHI